ncbi:MAG: amylo-alpha-1,6-glucosidase [Planctomycetaceae bacterium]|nr:amylo-alpha-1,6-glucosidase [Planctomycetaceae bacterium]
MLTRKGVDSAPLSVSVQDKSIDALLEREWLLSNTRGGFASGTVLGCNTRRYHSLLTGTLQPPANRIAALSNCLEIMTCRGQDIDLSCFEFDRTIHPKGFEHLLEFRKDSGVHFEYSTDIANLTKSLYLLPDSDIIALVYDFTEVFEPFDFSVRPFAAIRDFHALQSSSNPLHAVWNGRELHLVNDHIADTQLILRCDPMEWNQNPQWWNRFFYRVEKARGQDCFEDLWSAGLYKRRIEGPEQIVLWAGLFDLHEPLGALEDMDLQSAIDAIALREKDALRGVGNPDPVSRNLLMAADQFIIERSIEDHTAPSVLAGFPWFLDWGRDTFIALEGLCLCSGRYEEAWGILKTFAGAVSEGMIPNRFDDYGSAPHYNSIDASLWFVHAAFRYLAATDNRSDFNKVLLPAITRIMDAYRNGTRFGIHADSDGLITGGDVHTQLTWMDAKFGGIAFTPRYGKAVEINALWYSNLCCLSNFYKHENSEQAEYFSQLADQVRYSFRQNFWNEHIGFLNDCILPGEKADTTLRPNQVFAVSLPYSPLTSDQQKKVMGVLERELFTPYGLRTLNIADPRYKGRCTGPQGQRDAAYHQGSVWAFLIGPFVEGYLRVHNFDPTAKRRARSFLSKLIEHMDRDGCIGTISEIFDGDPPHQPQGAYAQAWSVAEVLRSWLLCKE